MTTDEMKVRTKKFSLTIINLAEKLPATYIVKVVANQIVRSGTSVGANYRAVAEQEVIKSLLLK